MQSRRATLGSLAGAAALLSSVAPSMAAFGDSANVFGKVTNRTGAIPFAGEGFAVLLPSKWNPSQLKEYPGSVLRFVVQSMQPKHATGVDDQKCLDLTEWLSCTLLYSRMDEGTRTTSTPSTASPSSLIPLTRARSLTMAPPRSSSRALATFLASNPSLVRPSPREALPQTGFLLPPSWTLLPSPTRRARNTTPTTS